MRNNWYRFFCVCLTFFSISSFAINLSIARTYCSSNARKIATSINAEQSPHGLSSLTYQMHRFGFDNPQEARDAAILKVQKHIESISSVDPTDRPTINDLNDIVIYLRDRWKLNHGRMLRAIGTSQPLKTVAGNSASHEVSSYYGPALAELFLTYYPSPDLDLLRKLGVLADDEDLFVLGLGDGKFYGGGAIKYHREKAHERFQEPRKSAEQKLKTKLIEESSDADDLNDVMVQLSDRFGVTARHWGRRTGVNLHGINSYLRGEVAVPDHFVHYLNEVHELGQNSSHDFDPWVEAGYMDPFEASLPTEIRIDHSLSLLGGELIVHPGQLMDIFTFRQKWPKHWNANSKINRPPLGVLRKDLGNIDLEKKEKSWWGNWRRNWGDQKKFPNDMRVRHMHNFFGQLDPDLQRELVESYQRSVSFLGDDFDVSLPLRENYEQKGADEMRRIEQQYGRIVSVKEMLRFLIRNRYLQRTTKNSTAASKGFYKERHGLTPVELAKALGVAGARIGEWMETDAQVPPIYFFHIIQIFESLAPPKNPSVFKSLMKEAQLKPGRANVILSYKYDFPMGRR